MKIVYLVGSFPKLSETFILNQITGLIDRGHEVEIVAYHNPKEEKVHADVIKYGLLEKTHYIQYNNELSLLNTKNVRQLVSCLDADLVHVHFAAKPAEVALNILKKIGIPYIITAHAYDIFISPDVEELRAKFSAAEKVITVSQFNRKYLLDLLGQEFSEKIEVQYLGIDLNKFKFIERGTGGKVAIIFIGRLVEKKGVLDAIEAIHYIIEKHPAVELRIIGEGPQKEEALRKVEEFKIIENVKFLGSLTEDKVTEEMERADIFFLPSVTAPDGDREGLPVVVLEAQAVGLPVVSTRHTGIPEAVLDKETGYLLEEHDTNGMAGRLCELIENPDLRNQMGIAGRKVVEARHELSKEIDRLERLIKEIVQSDKRSVGVEYVRRVSQYYAQVMEHLEQQFSQQIRQQEQQFSQQIRQQEQQFSQQIRQQEGQIKQLQRIVSEHDGFIKGIQNTIFYRLYKKYFKR
ncbi:MAG: hypothetical protein A2W23_10185 [Planctomycetes bacterium RBG_16_43_13]|nr:MAG: hypothetical protein A2W23_10185 [Planctomycetes bacterium RBG_16_43_13]